MALPQKSKRFLGVLGFVLLLNIVFLVQDVSDDLKDGESMLHIGPEIGVVVMTLFLLGVLARQILSVTRKSEALQSKLQQLEIENQDWKTRTSQYTRGLAAEIDMQMETWGLTQAEKEISLLLMKGLSNKEIAEIRQTSEPTIKQQASSIYRKSGLKTRTELIAFFLEDLLGPREMEG